MSSKKLGGLDKRIKTEKLNVFGVPSMFSADIIDKRADESGMSSVERSERLAGEAIAQAERDKLKAVQDEAAAKQAAIDAQNAQDEDARKKLREVQGGGYSANILAGSKNFGYGGGARRRLSGS